ncbi:PREDICTED: glucan endo-1,3-beta-glucosidase 1 [Tarenaya hassleriana]|uniref:glucan endo-1,3-beta-glucosidase 1 n=1 Tax=Tarenaya hassleriana TaxID=28532 RepID=UPI00053CA514|nr:PREDICTED: glucan endo-1,3-beta-glucosidase 1 [Tarenaya hassleriana]
MLIRFRVLLLAFPQMRERTWKNLLFSFLLLHMLNSHSVAKREAVMKSEAVVPITSRSPPEGNATFLEGTTWCVARPGSSQMDLQRALDWACGTGMADCSAIEEGGDCYEPNTLVSHASFAFNSYYQTNGNNLISCHFGGTAALTKINPSYGKCSYDASKSVVSAAKPLLKYKARWLLEEIFLVFMLLLYWRS